MIPSVHIGVWFFGFDKIDCAKVMFCREKRCNSLLNFYLSGVLPGLTHALPSDITSHVHYGIYFVFLETFADNALSGCDKVRGDVD